MASPTKLEKLIEQHKSILLAQKRLEQLKWELEAKYASFKILESSLHKEYRDVKKLMVNPLQNLHHIFWGNKAQKMEKEKEEYRQVVIQYNTCLKTIELLEFEQEVLGKKVEQEASIRKQLDQLIHEREHIICQAYPQVKNELLSISQELDAKIGYKRELHEAILMGLETQKHIQKIITILQQVIAGKDRPGGSSYKQKDINAKNEKIQQAHELSFRVKRLLTAFEKELQDVQVSGFNKRLDVSILFQRFHDIYYDPSRHTGFANRKIFVVIYDLKDIMNELKACIRQLKQLQKETEQSVAYLKKRKEKVVWDQLK